MKKQADTSRLDVKSSTQSCVPYITKTLARQLRRFLVQGYTVLHHSHAVRVCDAILGAAKRQRSISHSGNIFAQDRVSWYALQRGLPIPSN